MSVLNKPAAPRIRPIFIPPPGTLVTRDLPSTNAPGTTFNSHAYTGQVPQDWNTIDLAVYWTPTSANTGDVRIAREQSPIPALSVGSVIPAFGGNTGTTVAAPGVQWQFMRTVLGSGLTVTPGALHRFLIIRDGTHAADTYADDIRILGIELVRVS